VITLWTTIEPPASPALIRARLPEMRSGLGKNLLDRGDKPSLCGLQGKPIKKNIEKLQMNIY
jgi:hypothetical protein